MLLPETKICTIEENKSKCSNETNGRNQRAISWTLFLLTDNWATFEQKVWTEFLCCVWMKFLLKALKPVGVLPNKKFSWKSFKLFTKKKKDTIAREWSYPFECIKTLLRTCPIILICDRWNFHDLQTKINKCMAQHDDDVKRFISLCSNELISNVWQSSKSIEISIKFIRSFFINSWKPLTTDKNYTNIIVLCDWLIQRLDLIFYFFTREIII